MIGIIDHSDKYMMFNITTKGVELGYITVDNDENDTVIEDDVLFESYEYRERPSLLESDRTIWVKENSDLHKYLESNVYQDVMYGSAKYYKEYTPTTIHGIQIGRVGSVYDEKGDFRNNFIIIKDVDKRRNIKYDDTVFIPFILLNMKNMHHSNIFNLLNDDRSIVNDQIDFVFVRDVSQNIVDVLLNKFGANICTRNGNTSNLLLNDGTSISDVLLYTGPDKFDFICNVFKLINTEDILNKKVSVLAHFKVVE